jgi:uncharacterized membrane protein
MAAASDLLAHESRDGSRDDTRNLDRALGCFSIGLGVVEILAPRALGRFIGTGDHPTAFRLCGMREIASGLGLLMPQTSANAAFSRLAGDAMDLALLGAATKNPDARPGRLAFAATTVLGVAALDAYASTRHARSAAIAAQPVPVCVSLAINTTAEKLYWFWRNFENLPQFMRHLESVQTTGERASHWVAKAPGGGTIEWDAQITEDRPNELLEWCTLPGSQIEHRGRVAFETAPNGRGCTIHVEMVYDAPAGRLGALLAKMMGEEPELQIRGDLRRLKQLIETGELTTTRGQPAGRRTLVGKAFTRRES